MIQFIVLCVCLLYVMAALDRVGNALEDIGEQLERIGEDE